MYRAVSQAGPGRVARLVLPGARSMRLLGWLLVLYSALGAALLVLAVAIGGPLVSRADRLLLSAIDTMDAAAITAGAAADAFAGFDASLTEAEASAAEAAGLSRDTAITVRSLADAMALSIFGTQPLLPLAAQFDETAGQLEAMGDSLDAIGQALVTNREDVGAVGLQLRILSAEMQGLRVRIEAEQNGDSPGLSWLFYGFLAWQLLPITAAGIGGGWVLRRARETTAKH